MSIRIKTIIGIVVIQVVALSIVVWALSQVELLPVIGEWGAEIKRQIEEATELP